MLLDLWTRFDETFLSALLKKPREGKGQKGFIRKKTAATASAAKRARPNASDSGRHH